MKSKSDLYVISLSVFKIVRKEILYAASALYVYRRKQTMEKKKHLPLIGVGPVYVLVIIVITILGIILSAAGVLNSGKISVLHIPFAAIGSILIVIGVTFWISAVFQSKLGDNIKSNTLVTTGVYAYVRNPIYSAFMIMCTGGLFLANNCWLLLLPFVFWIFMTILMKNTEEKWLVNLYGQKYLDYCKHVNRCIPWFKK